jgi:YD repeat-containing protein
MIAECSNRVTRMTDALGRVTNFTYDACGNRTRIINPAGRVTEIAYHATLNQP